MSYGFRIRDASNNIIMSDADLGILLIDIFEVSPTTTGSKTYAGLNTFYLEATQTAKEPATTNRTVMGSFNAVNLSWSRSSSSQVLSWSPKFQIGTQYNVIIYVFSSIPP
jgi:hypothetical protein